MTARGQCLFKRDGAEVDQGLGKSKEIWPPLAIRSDERVSARGVIKEEGKVERLRHRLERTAQRAFDHQALLTRYRKFDFDQVATTAVDILRREHDPSHSRQGSRSDAQHTRLDRGVERGPVMALRWQQLRQRIHLGMGESRACELGRRSSCLEDSVSSTGDYAPALVNDDGANGNLG
jgi:hypothetical protein